MLRVGALLLQFSCCLALSFRLPLFKQCDPRWADHRIHVSTICGVGCLMSSTAMALHQRGILIPATSFLASSSSSSSSNHAAAAIPATPGTLNAWLLAHGGYVSGTDDLDEAIVARLDPARIAWTNASMHSTNDLSWAQVVALLHAGAAVIANVMHGHHFVLVVGVEDDEVAGDTLYVNDPGFHRAAYSYARDVVGWRLYAIAQREENEDESGGGGGGGGGGGAKPKARAALNAQIDAIYACGNGAATRTRALLSEERDLRPTGGTEIVKAVM